MGDADLRVERDDPDAKRKTVTTIVGRPKPNSAISAGTIAVSGELSKMFAHMPISSPTAFTRPIKKPTPMPTTSASAMPMPNAWRVMSAASPKRSEVTTVPMAARTSVKGGMRNTSSRRPTTSQMANQTRARTPSGSGGRRWSPRRSAGALMSSSA